MHRADFGKIALNYEGSWAIDNAVHDRLTTISYDGSLYIALDDTTVDDVPAVSGKWALAARGLTQEDINTLADTITVLTAEGVIPTGQDTITLPWTYNPILGNLAVVLAGLFQQRSTLTFSSSTTVTLDAAVLQDTPYMVMSAIQASVGGWNAGIIPTAGGVPQADGGGVVDIRWVTGPSGVLPAPSSGIYIGKVDLIMRPFDALSGTGWWPLFGDGVLLASPAGQRLDWLRSQAWWQGMEAIWVGAGDTGMRIVVDGSNIHFPNWSHSDGRMPFMRAVNGVSKQVGVIEEDKGRNATGVADLGVGIGATTGVFSNGAGALIAGQSGSTPNQLLFDIAKSWGVEHTGAEFAPLNRGMTPSIFLGV